MGVSERMDQLGGYAIRPFMPDQHREFFAQLPFIVAGAVDSAGDAWATLVPGQPGFVQSPSETRLDISAPLDPADPLTAAIEDGASIGLLGIELHTRRRNRMNGHVTDAKAGQFSVTVEHSFGNCPQYIQLREFEYVRDIGKFSAESASEAPSLSAQDRDSIAQADTFFVTSYVDLEGGRQVDISHRGGKPGFVRVGEDGVLTIPDYAGNLFFNTLGNFVSNPKAGIVFPDFETGDLLHLTGDAEVILDSPEIEAFEGAERLWTFTPRKVIRRPAALPLRWKFQEYSPNVMMTGSWDEAAAHLEAQKAACEWRPFRVSRIVDESDVIKSFYLEPADGKGRVRNQAGQHLPVQLCIPGQDKPVMRTYTLSSAPSDDTYRISVKKDGLFSTHLHEKISVGDTIEARAPQGNFIIDAGEKRPVVMLGAGVGITPFASMLRHLLAEGKRTRTIRPAWLFQAARTYDERAFDEEFEDLLRQSSGQLRLVRTLTETDEPENPQKGVKGLLSVDVLKAVLPFDDYDFYLCGPPGFMAALYNGLRDLDVADKRIFFEAFGPASVKRRPDVGEGPSGPPVSEEPVAIEFANSDKKAEWTPDSGSLLELAEANDISPSFSCRMGSCGSCKVKLTKGKVAYESEPSFKTAEDEVLLCCAKPAASDGSGDNTVVIEV